MSLPGCGNRDFDVVAVDYRGYGVSTGQPSERGLYRDVDATLAFVHEQLPRLDAPLIYWGRSLGTPVAAYAASRRAPDGVILEVGISDDAIGPRDQSRHVGAVLALELSASPPPSGWRRCRHRSSCCTAIATASFAYRLGQRLFERLPGPKRFVTLPGGDHNDPTPRDWPLYWDAVHGFVDGLPSRRPTDR